MDVILSGRVTFPSGAPVLRNARVELWDSAPGAAKAIAAAPVARGGAFTLVLPETVAAGIGQRQAVLELRLVHQGSFARLARRVTWRPGERLEGIELDAALDSDGRDPEGERLVYGRATYGSRRRPAPDLVVRAFDRDLRSEQLLGEARTGKDGRYSISYRRAAFARAEKDQADLAVKFYDDSGKRLLHEPKVEEIVYNAPAEARIDVHLKSEALSRGSSEFERLLQAVRPLIEDVRITDLAESREVRDIAFLSRETQAPADRLEHLVLAHRLAEAAAGPPAFFYALLRKDSLLDPDPLKPFRTAIGINSETGPLLLLAARSDPERLRRDVSAAAKERIVPALGRDELQASLDSLAKLRPEAERKGDERLHGKILDAVERLARDPDRVRRAADLLSGKGDFASFLDAAAGDWLPDEKQGDRKPRMRLSEAVATGRVSAEKVASAGGRRTDESKLAELGHAELADLIRKSERGIDPKLADAHARRLARSAEAAHPGAAIKGRLKQGSLPLRDPEGALKILDRLDGVDIKRANLDSAFAERKLDKDKNRQALADLKRVQRMLNVAPDLDRAQGLMEAGVESAADIVATGRSRFLREVAPKAGLSRREAKAAYRRAEARHGAALIIAGELQSLTSSAAAATGSGSAASTALAQSFPNLATLFGSTDQCECGHCRSVFSPAAYLVELLEFLGRRDMVDLTQTPPVHVNLAREQLFDRRPEIADIDLDCANAETPLPYIDLVCEILEEEVAPDAGVAHNGAIAQGLIPAALLATLQAEGWPVTEDAIVQAPDINGDLILRDERLTAKIHNVGANSWQVFRLRQTHGTAAELSAAPEYVNEDAYLALAAAKHAFTLPFDLAHAEAKAYFERFGLARAQLMRDFETAGAPAPEAIAAEGLGLTQAQRLLVVTADSAGQDQIWTFPAADLVDELKVVKTMLDRTGLTYEQLDRLLQMAFVDPDDLLFIRHLDLGCDLTKKEIAGLDTDALDRIHRFLRLQRSTGWADTILDAAIMQDNIGAKALDDPALVAIEQIVRLGARTGLKPSELVASFGEIPHEPLTGTEEVPLYQSIFLNKAVLGRIEDGLQPDAVGAGGTLSALAPALAALLKLDADGFERLRDALTDDQLTFANLSRLYGAARLTSRLKLKVADFLILVDRTGLDPFAGPAEMLSFVDGVERARSAPVKIADLPFLLEHDGEDVAARELSETRIVELLTGLQASYQAAFAETRSAFDAELSADELAGPLQDSLLRLPGMTDDGTASILRMSKAEWASPPDPDAAATLDALLAGYFDTADVVAAQAAVAAAAPAALEAARSAMAETLMASIAAYRLELAKNDALVEALATFSRKDSELVEAVLDESKLVKPGPGAPLLKDLLTDEGLIDTAGDPPAPPAIAIADFPEQFAAVRLLHKLLPLAASLALSADDIRWLLEHSGDMGWARLDSLPYENGQAEVAHPEWEDLTRMVAHFGTYSPVPDPADPEQPLTFSALLSNLLPGSATTRDEWLDSLSLMTGYDRETLEDLDDHFGWSAPNLDSWRSPATWETLLRCMEDLRVLGATVANAESYIAPALTSAETASLRVALQARYDEGIWLTTLGEIMNEIRPQKRDALVAWLLAERAEWTEPTDLYDHFLIDVGMESKMPSSRIVQAHGTIQLFVERSRMGLQPAAAADSSDEGWEQWTWMRNYRVWEANRKVFVHPENWIEPELLDDKSALFEALEDQLLENEVNEFTTEDAFIAYLEGLDALSFLEVVAVYHQVDIKTMHVFARTKGGDPAQYYHRRFESERYWTPWTLVELDITSDSLLAFVRNGRLHLAWPVVSEETDPDQEATTPGVSESPSSGPMQRPASRLKIQLAVSELANGVWKPRKISQGAIVSPPEYTTNSALLDSSRFNLTYNQFADQIWLFSTNLDGDYEGHQLYGIFDVTGCKGYPEVASSDKVSLPDFYPDYKDSLLQRQRYFELGFDNADSLAVRNMITFWGFVVRLNKTPGSFRVTHPHQFTLIDLFYLLLQILFLNAVGKRAGILDRSLKLPLGTWLPYFFENSEHAYVVVPGLYAKEGGSETKRTFSDFHQLLEDVIALVTKYVAKLTAVPAPDPGDVMDELVVDPDFLHIVEELQIYSTLQFGEQFRNLYHPMICPLRATLYKSGVGAMMKREQQLQQKNFSFATTFSPEPVVAQPYPVEDLDFSSEGSYSLYNWELFFHAPLMIAKRLASEQRFDEAMTWYHRIFDPTGTLEGSVPQKYWVTKPFYLAADSDYAAQRIEALLTSLADPMSPERHELELAVEEWRTKPFRPHAVARFRTTAYQRSVVMSYVGTLIEWGDYLFRQDTMESITQATQLYILAEKLLGPKPRVVPPPVEVKPETYSQLKASLDAFGNALVDLENYLPDLSVLPEEGAELPTPPLTLSSLYFCVPQNEKMLEHWDTVEDRLFKIRNSQNIEGVERLLSLFAPPIDPGMLVRAAAAGLDLSSILAGMNAPLPAYRFQVMARKATELAEEVRQLGNALLSALEKKDAEALALLRNDLEVKLQKAQRDLKVMEVESAEAQIELLSRTREVTEERHAFYAAFERINVNEQLNLDKLAEAQDYQRDAGIVRATGAVLGIIPDFTVGGHGVGGSPAVHATFGGSTLAHVADAAATVLNILGGIASYEASQAGTLAGFDRRAGEAELQERTSALELAQIDQQIVAAELRKDIAVKDLQVHDVQIANSEKISKTMTDKYTNADLYQWMAKDITSVYYRAYQLAYDTAKKAERCFQHELGRTDSFLAFGYWDSRRKGLQTADKLIHDIKRMEARFLELDRREYELTKHVSLRQLDPLALIRLRTTGTCDFEIPEALYDMDHPGHYFRRVHSIAITLPCVAGPYASVSARLSQVSNRYRASTARAAGAATPKEEYEEVPGNDGRFVYNVGAIQSVATSSGQNDSGLFQLDFRDDRYRPFEGTGAIGSWRLELPEAVRQFDYSTIADAIVHVRYTAREGGSSLKGLASTSLLEKLQEIGQELAKTGLHLMVDLKREYYNSWHELKSTGTTNLVIGSDRLPYFVQPLGPTLGDVTILAKATADPAAFDIDVDGAAVALNFSDSLGLNLNDVAGLALDTPIALSVDAGDIDSLDELSLVLKVDFS